MRRDDPQDSADIALRIRQDRVTPTQPTFREPASQDRASVHLLTEPLRYERRHCGMIARMVLCVARLEPDPVVDHTHTYALEYAANQPTVDITSETGY